MHPPPPIRDRSIPLTISLGIVEKLLQMELFPECKRLWLTVAERMNADVE